MTQEIVICEPVRTAIGGYGGQYKNLTAINIGVAVMKGLLATSGLPAEAIDEVILGNCYPTMDAPAIGRVLALDAGLPVTASGYQIDRRRGSGLQAIINAVGEVATGAAEVVVAGGVESMSNAAFFSTDMRWGGGRTGVRLHDSLGRGRVTAGGVHFPVPGGMIETAENLRREYSIPREEQDRLAVQSHQRAAAAQSTGVFAEEIVPVSVPTRAGEDLITTDEHIRAEASPRSMAGLRAIMCKEDPDATVTAGNASGQNDGAALCIVTTRDRADTYGLRPFVKLVSWNVAGVAPEFMGIGPVPATAAALTRAGLSLDDMDLIELNEAFAAQALAVMREWKVDPFADERVNVHGSGISLGHPVGATGGRMLATMARELHRRDGARYALETMCIGGGQGLAAIFEKVTA